MVASNVDQDAQCETQLPNMNAGGALLQFYQLGDV
jgi:hypothetical protein